MQYSACIPSVCAHRWVWERKGRKNFPSSTRPCSLTACGAHMNLQGKESVFIGDSDSYTLRACHLQMILTPKISSLSRTVVMHDGPFLKVIVCSRWHTDTERAFVTHYASMLVRHSNTHLAWEKKILRSVITPHACRRRGSRYEGCISELCKSNQAHWIMFWIFVRWSLFNV